MRVDEEAIPGRETSSGERCGAKYVLDAADNVGSATASGLITAAVYAICVQGLVRRCELTRRGVNDGVARRGRGGGGSYWIGMKCIVLADMMMTSSALGADGEGDDGDGERRDGDGLISPPHLSL